MIYNCANCDQYCSATFDQKSESSFTNTFW